jgi:RHS repeat-associated protein
MKRFPPFLASRLRAFLTSIVILAAAGLLWGDATVVLDPLTSPPSGHPTSSVISVKGSGFPDGNIPPENVSVTIRSTDPDAGPAGSTVATNIRDLGRTKREVIFSIPPSITVQTATSYQVSISGTTSDGRTFASSTSSTLTVEPPTPATSPVSNSNSTLAVNQLGKITSVTSNSNTTLTSNPLAQIVSVTPNSGILGQNLTVTIVASGMTLVPGATRASFGGAGVLVGGTAVSSSALGFGPVTVVPQKHPFDPPTVIAQIFIRSNAIVGPRTVILATADQQASLANGFTVNPAGSVPVITSFSPNSASVGTLINVVGNNFIGQGGIAPQVTLNQQGGGTIPAPVSTYTNTTLSFVVPAGAATGPITVTVGSQFAVSQTNLTIVPSANFTLGFAPNSVNLIPGQSATYNVTLGSNNGFNQLAALSVSGLPSGVTASFSPAQITAGQFSTLTVSAPSSQQTSSTNVTVTASATVAGILETQSAQAALNVIGLTTSFMGRTVVDNAQETPIAGVTVSFLGVDDKNNMTGCNAQTRSDAGGNFQLTNLPAACTGPQLVSYNGLTATSPPGTYAGVNLSYTLASGGVTTPPVLIHLPRIDNAETVQVQQNSSNNQVFTFSTIPGLEVTVYAGTQLSLDDGSQPNPFPLVAITIPLDRLPDSIASSGMLMPFIVAFQPANAVANQPVAVDFPNPLSTAPGTAAVVATLDPTRGYMVPYGTATVSNDGQHFIADADPSHPGHRYGLIHFDWHGPMPNPPNGINPSPSNPTSPPTPSPGCPACEGTDPGSPTSGKPVDLGSGVLEYSSTDLAIQGGRGSISIMRVFRSLSSNSGPFGIGTGHNYSYVLGTFAYLQGQGVLYLVMPDGNQFAFNQQPDGTFINSVIPALRGVVLTAAPGNNSYTLIWAEGTVYQFQTSSQGGREAFLTSIADSNGNTITLTLNPDQPQQITQITDPVGRSFNLSYDGSNRITSISDQAGRTVRYAYNGQNTLASYTDPAQQTTHYAYDNQNNLLSITDPRGVVTEQNTYDANGRVSQQIEADGGIYHFAYTLLNPDVPNSPVLSTVVTDPTGNHTTYRFNTEQFLTDIWDAIGQHRALTRDPNHNNLVSAYTGAGHCGVCGIPEVGDLSYTFDSTGNVLTQTDMLGNVTSFTYDPRFNRPTSITDRLNHTFTFTYDSRGNLLSSTNPDGHSSLYIYNAFGQLIKFLDPIGNNTTIAYDDFGNLSSITAPAGDITSFIYDALSRPIQVIDALGRRITAVYDPLGRITSQTNAQNKLSQFVYDQVGNLAVVTDSNGHQTTLAYDGENRLLTRTDPMGHADARTYDYTGNLVGFVDRRGEEDRFSYDSLNRISLERYYDGSTVSHIYDANGRLISAVDSVGGAVEFSYDAVGHMLSSSTPFGSVQYSYDAANRIYSQQVAGQPPLTYTYSAAGNPLSAVLSQASVNFAYDADQRLQTISRANGISTNYIYDPDGRVSNITHAGGHGINIPLVYSYDVVGNRLSQSTAVGGPLMTQPVTNTFDSANRLLTSGSTSYSYDANGNLASASGPSGTTTYSWDSRNRLTSITAPGQTTSFIYDFMGNVISTSGDGLLGLTQNILLDQTTNVAYMSQSNGDNLAVVVGRMLDQHLGVIHSSGQVEYGLTDAINSTVSTVDQTGQIVSSYLYEPFGQTTTASSYPFQFAGRVPIANIYNFRARFYNATLGRFVNEDPVGFGGYDINLYRYVFNSPVTYNDPFGLWQITYGGGFHVPVSAGIAVGPNISSSGLNRNPTVIEAAYGEIFDFGASLGVSGLAGCPADYSINIGPKFLGSFSLQITPQKNVSIFHPGTYLSGVSVGVGFGVGIPVTITAPLK